MKLNKFAAAGADVAVATAWIPLALIGLVASPIKAASAAVARKGYKAVDRMAGGLTCWLQPVDEVKAEVKAKGKTRMVKPKIKAKASVAKPNGTVKPKLATQARRPVPVRPVVVSAAETAAARMQNILDQAAGSAPVTVPVTE